MDFITEYENFSFRLEDKLEEIDFLNLKNKDKLLFKIRLKKLKELARKYQIEKELEIIEKVKIDTIWDLEEYVDAKNNVEYFYEELNDLENRLKCF